MEEVRCVVRLASRLNRRHQAGSCVPGRVNPLTSERCQGRCHERMPAGVSAGRCQLFPKNAVAGGVQRPQAQPARKRFVLRHGEVFTGHVLGQTRSVVLAVGDQRCFNLTVDLLLSALGGRDKAVQTPQLEEETGQANTARPDFDAHEVEGQHQPVPTSESGTTLKESSHLETDIPGVMPCTPGVQRGAGNLKLLSRLTLGHTLGSQRTIGLAEVRPFEAIPAWLAVSVTWLRVLDDGSHSDLLGPSLAL
jgi:hypothetical protein